MSCSWFDERLDELLADDLPADDQARAAAHAADCPRCGEVYALLSEASGHRPAEAPVDLADAVLSRTSGRPCERARASLGDLLDGALGPVERRLVEAHLDHCADCATLAAAAARLGAELPAFAEMPPPFELVDAVLARTHGRAAGRPAAAGWYSFPRPARPRRWRDAARRLLTRPRIAWEAGYVAALLFWLVFGASWSPLRTTAVEARILIEQGVSVARDAGADSVASVNRALAAVSERTVRAAHDVSGAAGRFADPWYRRVAAAAPDLGRHWRDLAQALEDRDVFGGVDALRSLSRDAGAMLAELLSPSFSTTATDDAPRPAERSRP